jgi:thiamine kinase-like enzyme
MNAEDDDLARRTLAATGMFGAEDIVRARISRLFGLTNLVFKVELPTERLALRIPNPASRALIDRAREEKNAREAARIGVAPEVLHFSSSDGVMLTRFIEGAPMSPQLFRENPEAIARTARAFRQLHDEAGRFTGAFDVFERIGFYRDLLEQRGSKLSSERSDLVDRTEAIRQALAAQPVPPRPCHCDPTGRNLLDAGDRIWLIDWEYSGMNDPTWDLAYVSVEAGFDAGQDGALLAAYFGRPAAKAEAARLHAFKALCQLLSALWALVQRSGGNRTADFLAHAEATFAEAGTRMRGAEFAKQLDLLRQG